MRPRKRPPPKPIATGGIRLSFLDETYVYRIYCPYDDLLYVGMTNNLATRLAWHRRESRWMIFAERAEWELFGSRIEAERAEYRQIRELQPRHNFRDAAGRRPVWKPLPWPGLRAEAA